MHGEGKLVWETPGGSVPRWTGACSRGIAIRCDIERTRGWLDRGPQPGCRRFGGAPPACQRSRFGRIAWGNNTESRARFRGRKVPEWSHPLAPDSRRWRAVGRRALRAMGNISVMLPLACHDAITLKNKLFLIPACYHAWHCAIRVSISRFFASFSCPDLAGLSTRQQPNCPGIRPATCRPFEVTPEHPHRRSTAMTPGHCCGSTDG